MNTKTQPSGTSKAFPLSSAQSSSSMGRKAVRGALWQLMGGGWTSIVRLGASVFLARALTPEDFGIFGLAILARNFLSVLGSLGMGSGIIAKKEVTEVDLSTCFWTMAGARVCLFLLGFFGAPIGGYLLGDIRVVPVLKAVSFLFLTSAIEVVPNALFLKTMNFGKLNAIQGFGILFESTLAVILALYTELEYWALVYAMLIASICTSLAITISSKWYPKFEWSNSSFQYLFKFGIAGLGFNIVNHAANSIDYLLIGRVLGVRMYGLYEFAYKLPFMIYTRLVQTVGSVLFPFLSTYQDSDDLVLAQYIDAVHIISIIALWLLLLVGGAADILVPLLWGNQWLEAISPMRILSIAAGLRVMIQPIGSLFFIKEKPKYMFYIGAMSLGAAILFVPTLSWLWGLNGAAVAMIIVQLPYWIGFYHAINLYGGSFLAFLRKIKGLLIAVTCTTIFLCIANNIMDVPDSNPLRFFLTFFMFGVTSLIYFGILFLNDPSILRHLIARVQRSL